MCFLLFIFYWTSSASSFPFRLDGALQVGPEWEYKLNFESPVNAERPYGRNTFRRSIISESDDTTSQEDETEEKNQESEELTRSRFPTTLTEKPSERHHKLNRHDETHKIKQWTSPYYIPNDSSDDEKYHRAKSRRKPKQKYESANNDYSDAVSSSGDTDAEDNSFPKRFTQPLIETKEKEDSDSVSDTKENNKNKNKHKNTETVYTSNPQSNFNHKINKKKVKYDASKIDQNANLDVTGDTYKHKERFFNPSKNSSLLIQWKHKIEEKKKQLQNLTNIIANKVNNLQNKTKNFIEVRLGLSQLKNKWNNLLEKVNFNDFYSTPAVLPPYNPKKAAEMKKVLRTLQNETKAELTNLFKNLNHESQRIKDNDTINSFTKYILQSTLKLFDNVKEKSTEYRWKKKMKHLAKSYEDRFNEFLRATKHHTIRTRLGTRKVILNAIDVSKRIVNRLVNFMANDMDKRGLVYNNLTLIMFKTEIDKVEAHHLKRACKKLDICKDQKSFTNFMSDMLFKMLTVPNDKFKLAFDAMIKSAKITDFALSKSVDEGIKKKLGFCGRQNVNVQRGMTMIVKNMITYRNTPLIVYNDSKSSDSKLKLSLSLLEIINTLDEKVPNDKKNVQEWDSLSREMEEWVQGRNENVQSIMTRFMSHISNVIKEIDSNAWDIILQNAEILFL